MLAILNIAMFAFSGAEGGGSPLDVNPGLIIWTVVTFIFLLLILKKLAWKPILSSLSQRENFIKDSLEKAEQAQKEAQRLSEENKVAFAKAESEAQKIISQSRDMAEKLKAQMLDESKLEAKKMIEHASAEIIRKNQEAFNSLKGQVAEIAIQAAEKIIKETLDKDKQTKLIEKYINDFTKN